MRVAVAQFAIGTELDANLATCLEMLDESAGCNPDLVVLPEFCNHLSWYESAEHCFEVSLDREGGFLAAIAARARAIKAHVVINCTLRREPGICSGTSLLYSPAGELLAVNDKQVLIGHENDFLRRASEPGPVVTTDIGTLGLYACMDGVINETPRGLALRGAQLLCNSLNSFASDEGSLHIPVRAAENKVFVAAANKVGPLIPGALLAPVSAETGIPEKFLNGAGESQIVAPDGTVLACASLDKPEVVYADVDLQAALDKRRPDGTDVVAARRPALYSPLAEDPAQQSVPAADVSERVQAALVQLSGCGSEALVEAEVLARSALAAGASLVALPPLFFLPGQQVVDPLAAQQLSAQVLERLAACCQPGQYISTSLIMAAPLQLRAVLIGSDGLVLGQGGLHHSERFAFSPLVDSVAVADLGFARVALLTSDDAIFPEAFRLAALAGADTVIVPAMPLEAWEASTGLLERSAENRVNLLAAMQPGPLGASMSTCLTRDFTVMTPWDERPFDGLLSQPPFTVAEPTEGITRVEIQPRWAANKVVSRGTDLLAGRPWQLLDALCAA